ncbi:MAG: S8 family serine peptidase [Myxococcota bacterium]
MRRLAPGIAALGLGVAACLSPVRGSDPRLALWRPPSAPTDPLQLHVEPARLAVPLGTPVVLRLRGALANDASCHWAGGNGDGPRIKLPPRFEPGPLRVRCRAEASVAEAQITYTAARRIPRADPYGGGVVLFKLRRRPDSPGNPSGTRKLGIRTLDRKLAALGAWVLPAFPIDHDRSVDRVGLDRWIVIDLPEDVNFYQAVELLRSDPYVYRESYLPEDGAFLRVRTEGSWPVAFVEPRRHHDEPAREMLRTVGGDEAIVTAAASWDLEEIGAPAAWRRGRGRGVGIGIVDTGVDVNHLAISPNLRSKTDEPPREDRDGNGVPGDWSGLNLAHLAILHSEGPPRLALGIPSIVEDWDGIDRSGTGRIPGHGTAIAAAAAGAGGAGGRLGVAPQAWLLPVDVQENLRVSASRLIADDPRMRELAGQKSEQGTLRSSVWARALAVVYAVREGVRVITCAWPPQPPHWILHDVLLYAEENCVLPVCSEIRGLAPDAAAQLDYPARWRVSALRDRDRGTGDGFDAFAGTILPDFFQRPLRALVVVGGWRVDPESDPMDAPDVRAPRPPDAAGHSVLSAVSNPRNDSTLLPDRRTAPFTNPDIWAGLGAGAAALVIGARPDLEAERVRDALVSSARVRRGTRRLWIPGALEHVAKETEGSCTLPPDRRTPRHAITPAWQRVRIRTERNRPTDDSEPVVPASPTLP